MNSGEKTSVCPKCGTERPSENVNEPCPGCLLKMTAENKDSAVENAFPPTLPSNAARKFTPPTPQELGKLFPNLEV